MDAAIQAALIRPQMFHCPTLSTGPATLSQKQCLFNQSRHKAQGFPHSCSQSCVQGARVRRQHKGETVPEVQFNILQGGFTAGNRQVELDSPAPVCPAKRIAREKQIFSGSCPVHKIEKLQDRRGRWYCPTCRHERLRKNAAPKCEVHGCNMVRNAGGRWYCERCASVRNRRGAETRKGVGGGKTRELPQLRKA